MRISDWSSDVCSSDLIDLEPGNAFFDQHSLGCFNPVLNCILRRAASHDQCFQLGAYKASVTPMPYMHPVTKRRGREISHLAGRLIFPARSPRSAFPSPARVINKGERANLDRKSLV